MSRLTDPRVRELTPPGSGSVSVIALDGPGVFDALHELAPKLSWIEFAPQRVRLVSRGEALDEALALVTSAERVELHVHGNPMLVRRLMSELGAGVTTSEVERGSSLEQRALTLLESAASEAGARILLDQAEGALRHEIEVLARLDDDRARACLAALLEASRVADFVLRARRVVLAGPVNAGKSTLFNVLFGRRRVVVSAQAGTTRDVVDEHVLFGEWPVELLDTAGERESDGADVDEIERGGQRLGREARARADLVLWLVPARCWNAAPESRAGLRVLLTHCDEQVGSATDPPRISALAQPIHAVESVHATFRAAFDLPASPWRSSAPIAFDAPSRAGLQAAAASLRVGADWRAALSEMLAEA